MRCHTLRQQVVSIEQPEAVPKSARDVEPIHMQKLPSKDTGFQLAARFEGLSPAIGAHDNTSDIALNYHPVQATK